VKNEYLAGGVAKDLQVSKSRGGGKSWGWTGLSDVGRIVYTVIGLSPKNMVSLEYGGMGEKNREWRKSGKKNLAQGSS